MSDQPPAQDDHAPPREIAAEEKRERSLRRRNCACCLAAVAVPLILIIVAYPTALWLAERNLEAYGEGMRARGVALDIEQIIEPLPEGAVNAAPAWQEAFAAEPVLTDDEMRVVDNLTDAQLLDPDLLTEEQRMLLQSALEKAAPMLAEAAEAADLPDARWPVNWSDAPAAEMGHVTGLRMASRWATRRALIRIGRGDRDGALRDVRTALAAAEHLEHEPTLISLMVAVAVRESARPAIGAMVARDMLTADQAAALAALHDPADLRRHMHTAQRGELAWGWQVLNTNDDAMLEMTVGTRASPIRLVFLWDAADYLSWQEHLVTALDPATGDLAEARRISQGAREDAGALSPVMNMLRTDIIDTELEALCRTVLVQAMLELARAEAAGDDADLPADPLTGDPVRWNPEFRELTASGPDGRWGTYDDLTITIPAAPAEGD